MACSTLGLLLVLFGASAANLFPNGRQWLTGIMGPVNLILGVAFFGFGLIAGRGLLSGKRWAISSSLAIQLVQAVSFAVLGGPHLHIAAGPAVDLIFSSGEVAAQLGFHWSFILGTRVQGPAWEVTINLLAIAWAVALARMLRGEPEQLLAPPA
ncbi:MAG: hypothetical protein EBR86_10850 [Planctomycetia bacterium]|nr:hypothetical protein [Planctomycetia bacterium]